MMHIARQLFIGARRQRKRKTIGARPLKFRPFGRSKYTGEMLRAIRARKVNFLKEMQR